MKFLHSVLWISGMFWLLLFILKVCTPFVSWELQDINAILGFHVAVRILLIEDQLYRLGVRRV